MNPALQSNPLAILVDLEKRARSAATIEELHFLIANETHNLSPYRQAILFKPDGTLLTFSGVSEFSEEAPFVHWLKYNISPYVKGIDKPCHIRKEDLSLVSSSDWNEWFPAVGFLIPLFSGNHRNVGSVFLLRDYNWNEDEQEILQILAGAYGHALGALEHPRRALSMPKAKGFLKIFFLLIVISIFAFRVPLTVLAPAEIVAVNPSVVRAPIDGVVERVLVEPNQIVEVGDLLLRMDAVSQRNELEIAKKIFSSLKAQFSQVTRMALSNQKSKRYLTEIKGRMKQQEAQIKYLNEVILRMSVSSPVHGAVIIDDPQSWEGRPVRLGEKIISLADQKEVEIEAWLSISDAIELPVGSLIRVYLNAAPLSPIEGALRIFSYEAEKKMADTYSYRIRGRILNKDKLPRLGLRGTARIEGEKVSLFYWVFRRPISFFRQFFGV